MKIISLIILIITILIGVESLNNSGNKIKEEIIPSLIKFKNNNINSNLNKIDYNIYLQKVDHFNLLDDRRFYQRFVVNDNYWNGTGPVFFIVGGEGELSLGTVTDYQTAIWAKELNALIVSLEHRYYGNSMPMSDLSTDNLKYLTTQQALADCVTFLNWFIQYYNIQSVSKIGAFGGSYAGLLSTYLVSKYPNIFNFAISSSAPFDPVLNFYQYYEAIQSTILSFEGGDSCLENIQNATLIIQSIVQDIGSNSSTSTSSSEWIKETFNLCKPLISDLDKSFFMESFPITWSIASQNLDNYPNPKDTKSLCSIMNNNDQDPLTNYIESWYVYHLKKDRNVCYPYEYDAQVSLFSNTTNSITKMERQWLFQTCTEFGFQMTSDGSSDKQPFGGLITLDYKSKLCQDVFGIGGMTPSINWTILEYGGLYPNFESVENVLFVTGTNDPWSLISISPSTIPDINYNTIVIQNGAHCSDIYQINSASVPDVTRAQNEIFQFILYNLNK